jgi:hypothetical protein
MSQENVEVVRRIVDAIRDKEVGRGDAATRAGH